MTRPGPAAVAAGLLVFLLSCHRSSTGGTAEAGPPMTIAAAIARHSTELLEIPGVVGVAQGAEDGRDVVQIMVERRTPALEARLPRRLEGYPVVVVESGPIRSQ
jgi:hypothetical protein